MTTHQKWLVVLSLALGGGPTWAAPPSDPNSVPDPSKDPIISQPPVISQEASQKWDESNRLTELGGQFLSRKDWKKAQEFFLQSLAVWDDNSDAWYGLSQCYTGQGDRTKALKSYSKAVYSRVEDAAWSTSYPYREGNVAKLMHFALMLDEAKQTDEAASVYNYAVRRLNYRDNKPYLKVLLPEFGLNAGQRTYQPVLFRAMAHTAIGLTINETDLAVEHLDEAARLLPNSGVIHFHRAKVLRLAGGRSEEAKAEYERARSLDPKAAGSAAEVELDSFPKRMVNP